MKTLILIFVAIFLTCSFAFSSDSLKVVYPNGGEAFKPGDKVTIKWEGVPANDTVSLYYSIDRGFNWTLISETASGFSYEWDVPNVISKYYLIKVERPVKSSYIQNYALGNITSSSLSFDKTILAVSFPLGTVYFYDTRTNKLVDSLPTLSHSINFILWSKYSDYLFISNESMEIELWNTKLKKCVRKFDSPLGPIRKLKESNDGTKLLGLSHDDHIIYVWDKRTGKFDKFFNIFYEVVTFDYENEILVTAGQNIITLNSAGNIKDDTLRNKRAISIKILDDKIFVFTANKMVLLYDLNLKFEKEIAVSKNAYDIMKLTDDKYIVRIEDGYDVLNQNTLSVVTTASTGYIQNLIVLAPNKIITVDPSSIKAISLYNNQPLSTVKINAWEPIDNFFCEHNLDGNYYVDIACIVYRNRIDILDLNDNKVLRSIERLSYTKLGFSGDGKKLIFYGNSIIYDIEKDSSFDTKIKFDDATVFNRTADIFAMKVNDSVCVYNINKKIPIYKVYIFVNNGYKLFFHPERNLLLVSNNYSIQLYDVDKRELVVDKDKISGIRYFISDTSIIYTYNNKLNAYDILNNKSKYSFTYSNVFYHNQKNLFILENGNDLSYINASNGNLEYRTNSFGSLRALNSDAGKAIFDNDVIHLKNINSIAPFFDIKARYQDEYTYLLNDKLFIFNKNGLISINYPDACISNSYFEVKGPEADKHLKIISPTKDSLYHTGDKILVKWEPVDISATYTIDYTLDSGQAWTNLTVNASGGAYQWNSLGIKPSNKILLRIEKNDPDKLLANRTIGTGGFITYALTPDNKKFLGLSEAGLFIWDAKTLERTDTIFCGGANKMKVLTNDKVLIWGYNKYPMLLWDINKKTIINKYVPIENSTTFYFSLDSTKFAIRNSRDSLIYIYHTNNLELFTIINTHQKGENAGLVFVENDNTIIDIVSINNLFEYNFYNINSGELVKIISKSKYCSISPLPNSNYLIATNCEMPHSIVILDQNIDIITTLEPVYQYSYAGFIPNKGYIYFVSKKTFYFFNAYMELEFQLPVDYHCVVDNNFENLYYIKDAEIKVYNISSKSIIKSSNLDERRYLAGNFTIDKNQIFARNYYNGELIDTKDEKSIQSFDFPNTMSDQVIAFSPSGDLAAYISYGVVIYNFKSNEFKKINIENEMVYSCSFLETGELLIASTSGLSKYNPLTLELILKIPFREFYYRQNLNNNYININREYDGWLLTDLTLNILNIIKFHEFREAYYVPEYGLNIVSSYVGTYIVDNLGNQKCYINMNFYPNQIQVNANKSKIAVWDYDFIVIFDKDLNILKYYSYKFNSMDWYTNNIIMMPIDGLLKFFYIDGDIVDTSEVFAIEPPVKAEEEKNSPFELYPNPAKDYIKISSAEIVTDIEIFDSYGKRIIGFSAAPASGVISTSSMANGSYSVNFKINGKRYSKKFIVIK